jgi:hypothetical protein
LNTLSKNPLSKFAIYSIYVREKCDVLKTKKGPKPLIRFINAYENYAPPPVIKVFTVLPTAVPIRQCLEEFG